MNIIMLVGAPNTGKTTTLNHLFNKLKDDYNGVVVEKCPHDNNQDYFYIINVGKCHIAIATMGDIVYEIKKYFEKAKVTNCDWLICANSLKLYAFKLLKECEMGFTLRKSELSNEEENKVINRIIDIFAK